MTEFFLHYLWRYKRFDCTQLRTTEGQPIELIHPGEAHGDGGPDFSNARLRIGDTLWAGTVEIHLRASDWYRHGHHGDPHYANVVLHVVLDEDTPVRRAGGERLPCLELRQRIPPQLPRTYLRLLAAPEWVPCQRLLGQVSVLTRHWWLDRLLLERLEAKTQRWWEQVAANQGDWAETLYQSIARYLGAGVNAAPFEQLARELPYALLQRHRHNLLELEALLLGHAGLLSLPGASSTAYGTQLCARYTELKRQYGLASMAPVQWKWLRLRPANFPSIRLAQLASLLYGREALLEKALAIRHLAEAYALLGCTLHPFWTEHYALDRPSGRSQVKKMGRATLETLVTNVLVPLFFAYGQQQQSEAPQQLALAWLQELPPEQNSITQRWVALGLENQCAAHSQALLQLKQHYCNHYRCLQCGIGHALLGSSVAHPDQ